MAVCNICSSVTFLDFNGRKSVLCSRCNSLERHRLVHYSLTRLGYLDSGPTIRILHLAPEESTHRYIDPLHTAGYICADLTPSNYPHAKCLRLALPDGFDIFPNQYFDLILHNHVLEHIPGDYRSHLAQFLRLLKSGGHMVFTVPNISSSTITIQYGENLATDDERLILHGQGDHYKSFGYDFFEWFKARSDGCFMSMDIPNEVRDTLSAPIDQIFVFKKN